MEKAREAAAARGETLTSLIERGIALALARGDGPSRRRRIRLPVSRSTGGTLPGVDLNNSAALLDLMDDPL